MKNLFFFLISLFNFVSGELVWTEKYEELAIKTFSSNQTLDVSKQLTLIFQFSPSAEFEVDKDRLRENILNNESYGDPPLQLISEKVKNVNNTETITYIFSLNVTGNFYLTFGEVTFFNKKKEPLFILTEIFPLKVTMQDIKEPKEAISPLLDFSTDYPIQINEKNKDAFIENKQILQAERDKIISRFRTSSVAYFIFGLLFLIKLVPIVLIGYRFYIKNKAERPPPDIAVSLKELFFEKLEELNAKKLPQKGDFNQFFVSLSLILREFIEKNEAIQVSALTTSEFLNQFSQKLAHENEITKFLMLSDQIKFAKKETSENVCKEAYATIFTYIKVASIKKEKEANTPSMQSFHLLKDAYQWILRKFHILNPD